MIRPAGEADVPVILELVHELAHFEQQPEAVVATPAMLTAALFGPAPVAWCHLAEEGGQVVGLALWYLTFSTWTGRSGLWLEDLFVRPVARGRGIGRALLERLAAICAERGYSRFEWCVLDWNVDAQGFYRSLGAIAQEAWTVWRLEGEGLATLAAKASASGGPRPLPSSP